jgi:hypothetical protein
MTAQTLHVNFYRPFTDKLLHPQGPQASLASQPSTRTPRKRAHARFGMFTKKVLEIKGLGRETTPRGYVKSARTAQVHIMKFCTFGRTMCCKQKSCK